MSTPAPRPDGEVISYEQWGRDFFAAAVSEERVLRAVDGLAGQPVELGPMGVGPGRIAKVRAHGAIGQATATPRIDDGLVSYRVELPVDLTFDLDLQVETQTFHAELVVPLVLTARALDGLRIWIDLDPPEPREVKVQLEADGLRASIVKHVADVEGEVRRFVATYVAREAAKPHVARARLIDVSAAIDSAWAAP